MMSQQSIGTDSYLPPCLLLAEDDYELRSMVASTLRREGFDVVEVRNGNELLEQVGSSLLDGTHHMRFDLIITDLRMPGKSGLDILNGLDQGGITTPVLLMTAFGDERTHALARRFGAVGVLDKPFDLDDLIALVAEAVWHPADAIAPDASVARGNDQRGHRVGSYGHHERAAQAR
jgi:DNA-binding response OmpR family regulator